MLQGQQVGQVLVSGAVMSLISLWGNPPRGTPLHDGWFPLFSLSVLLVLSLEQQWLDEPTCNVEILHRAQMEQDVYIYGIRTYHIYINI